MNKTYADREVLIVFESGSSYTLHEKEDLRWSRFSLIVVSADGLTERHYPIQRVTYVEYRSHAN